MIIKLLRHGLSGANTGEEDLKDVPDHKIKLVPKGIEQARAAGVKLGPDFIRDSIVYCSPYKRTRQTTLEALVGAGLIKSSDEKPPLRLYEDPRLREVEMGYDGQESINAQREMRDKIGYFWYQMERGESPVQAYDRVSGFLESFMRQMKRKNKKSALIVSHGLTIRIFVMRFFHLTVEEFDLMRSPDNCDIITIGPKDEIANPQFVSGKWAVSGLRLTTEGAK
ncbi:MAG: histidine phosphatase family protein [Cyanobacteria bacterium SZAS LIN-3]|nr:histidine phosphatase family protein [Cyanobacteria bacterium SZAS LIN-3]